MKKQYGREFLSLDVVFDALYMTSNIDAKYRLRTPLAALVDYKGFRAIVTAELPIKPEHGLSLGFNPDGKYEILDYQLKTEL